MSAVQAVLFTLSGGGDTATFLAPRSAFDWCYAAEPGTWDLPKNVRADITPFLRDPTSIDGPQEIEITPGSADNDAAMFLAGVCREFDNPVKAIRYATQEGIELDEDNAYDGYIY